MVSVITRQVRISSGFVVPGALGGVKVGNLESIGNMAWAGMVRGHLRDKAAD